MRTRPGSRRIPERELRSLSTVNRPGFSEDMNIQSEPRRSKPTLFALRQRYQTNREEARDLLACLPKSRTGPILPDDLTEFKGTFNKLKLRTGIIQELATEMTDMMANQGASAEAQDIIKEVSDLQQIVATIRHEYDDVLSLTSSMYTGSHRSRIRSRSASAHSNASRRTTDSEIDRRKQAELRREIASTEAQEIYAQVLADKNERLKKLKYKLNRRN